MLDQRWVDQRIARRGKRIQQRTARFFHTRSLGRQHIFNVIGENPFAHGAGEAVALSVTVRRKQQTRELLTANSTEPTAVGSMVRPRFDLFRVREIAISFIVKSRFNRGYRLQSSIVDLRQFERLDPIKSCF